MHARQSLIFKDEHQIGEEQQQVHRAEQDISAIVGKRERAESQRQQQQDRIHCVEAEKNGLAGEQADGQHRRNRQPDSRQCRIQ